MLSQGDFKRVSVRKKSGKPFIFTNTALFMDHVALPIFRELNSPQQSYHVSNREAYTQYSH